MIAIPLVATAAAGTVFNEVTGTGAHGLFQENGGTVTAIPTGLDSNDFPSLSRDGRFITISAADSAQPSQTSTDLWLWDRATNTRRRLVNYSTEQLQDGSFATSNPSFSALSPDNSLFAMVTNLLITTNNSGSSVTPRVTMHRSSDGFQLNLVEIGQGNALDFFRSEYTGITWSPDGTFFAMPTYVNVVTANGNASASVGIATFGFNGTEWVRTGQLTQPQIFDNVFPSVIETHIFPAISPDGGKLGFFLMTWPDALLQGPVQARLMVQNLNGSGLQQLVLFNPGYYPLGLTWSTDGTQLIFSIANQTQQSGGYPPSGVPQTAVVRAISAAGGTPVTLPGINTGFFPGQPSISTGGGVDLSKVHLRLDPATTGDGFVLTTAGLDPTATYRLESTTDLSGAFGNGQNFTGAQIMNGITIPQTETRKFFRIANP